MEPYLIVLATVGVMLVLKVLAYLVICNRRTLDQLG